MDLVSSTADERIKRSVLFAFVAVNTLYSAKKICSKLENDI